MGTTEQPPHRGHQPIVAQKSNNNTTLVLGAVAALVIILIGAIAAWALNGGSSSSAVIDNSKYQAIFLTNNQNYFGKLQSLNSDYFKLTDIYYLQAPQASTETDDTSSSQKLVKLGDELHGPEDAMIISKDQVLFFENLKPDSKVTKLIEQNKQSK